MAEAQAPRARGRRWLGPLATALFAGRQLSGPAKDSSFVPAPGQHRQAGAPAARLRGQRQLPAQPAAKGGPSKRTATVARRASVADSNEESAAAATAAASVAAVEKASAVENLTYGVIAAVLFCAGVGFVKGALPATEWLSCYLIEYSLSIDNLFVFIIIFKYFKVPAALQSNVLNYGILGAIIFRFVFVFLGAIVLQEFQFLILGFAAVLLYASYTGITKDDDDDDDDEDLDNNFIVQNLRKVFDVTPKFEGEKFFTEVEGKTFITPLLLCLLTIEFSDIVFATDSVPAVLGTTQDAFIAYSSNIFAVIGLRSLFFLLQEAIVSFSFLESAVNFVLGFIGLKIILDYFEIVQIDVVVSLVIVLGTLVTGVVLSIKEMQDIEAAEAKGKD